MVSDKIFRQFLDFLPQKAFIKDTNGVILFVDNKFAKDLASTPEQIQGKTIYEIYPRDIAEKLAVDDRDLIKTGEIRIKEEKRIEKGKECIVQTTRIPLKDENNQICAIGGFFTDITKERQMEERIKQQAKDIIENSIPVIQVIQGVMIAPIIGTLDSQRTQQMMERILNSIIQTKSSIALIDITGVPTIDTITASHLIETVNAIKLIGAKVIITGIRPVIAQTLVHLGIDLSNIITQSSLENGLRIALEIIGLKIVSIIPK